MDNNKTLKNIMIVQSLLISVTLINLLDINNTIIFVVKIMLLAFAMVLTIVALKDAFKRRKSK